MPKHFCRPASGSQHLPAHGLAFPDHLKNAKPSTGLEQHSTLTRHCTILQGSSQAPCRPRAGTRQKSTPEPVAGCAPQCAAFQSGPPDSTASNHQGRPLTQGGCVPRSRGKDTAGMRLHVPEADSTWAPFTFRGVRTTRGSITPVFFFCLFAYTPERINRAQVSCRANKSTTCSTVSQLLKQGSCSATSAR